MTPLRIGTSGWTYRHWRGTFYPPKLPQREWLAYYAERFRTVELNVTTYRLPKENDLARWSQAPPEFDYSIKLSRLITHRRRPGEPRRFVETYFERIAPLMPRVANVLAQFPPSFARDDDALAGFLEALPAGPRYVTEFREASWYDEAVYGRLRARGISLCLHDLGGSETPHVVTGPVLYVRLHGPTRAYAGSYSIPRLQKWAETISTLASQVEAVYVYFNNDERAYATQNAMTLRELLDDSSSSRRGDAGGEDGGRRIGG